MRDADTQQLERVLSLARDVLGPDALGGYLFGSAVLGGLQPESDLDVLVVSARQTTREEKQRLVARLLAVSGRITPQGRWRRVELTIVVEPDIKPWRYPPSFDFQYGDWLRGEFESGNAEPWPTKTNPDLAALITMVLLADTPVLGPPPAELLDPVPHDDLVRAIVGDIDGLLGDLDTDTGNVLLTLARIWSTVATGVIRSKDAAADWALTRLPRELRPVLARARAIYLGDESEHWDDIRPQLRSHADRLVAEINRSLSGPSLPDVAALLSTYDTQLRGQFADPLPQGVRGERDGPLLRLVGAKQGGFVEYRDLAGLEGTEVDELIASQVRVFTERGERFEWKLHEHDRPADLAQRLRAAGFVSQEAETVVIASVAGVAGKPRLPEGVSLREVTDRADFDRIALLKQAIWGSDHSWLADSFVAERTVDSEALAIVVAEADDTVVCAAWARFARGTEFVTLWGGGTLPAWRGRGIYRAIVAYRATLAAERGFRYLQVDASDASRPILERLGFVAVTTTTPFIWSPPAVVGDVARNAR